MSICSIRSSNLIPGLAAVSTNGYRLTTTRSTRPMPCCLASCEILGMMTPREDAAVNLGMERLDAPVHHFGEAGHVADVDHRQAPRRPGPWPCRRSRPARTRAPTSALPNGIRPVLSETLRIARRIESTPSGKRNKNENPTLWIAFSELTPNVTAQYHPRSPFLRTRRPQVAAFFCCPHLIQKVWRG